VDHCAHAVAALLALEQVLLAAEPALFAGKTAVCLLLKLPVAIVLYCVATPESGSAFEGPFVDGNPSTQVLETKVLELTPT